MFVRGMNLPGSSRNVELDLPAAGDSHAGLGDGFLHLVHLRHFRFTDVRQKFTDIVGTDKSTQVTIDLSEYFPGKPLFPIRFTGRLTGVSRLGIDLVEDRLFIKWIGIGMRGSLLSPGDAVHVADIPCAYQNPIAAAGNHGLGIVLVAKVHTLTDALETVQPGTSMRFTSCGADDTVAIGTFDQNSAVQFNLQFTGAADQQDGRIFECRVNLPFADIDGIDNWTQRLPA